jgi:outer membrane protein OmpA-like peptidoglycan-associated protein
MMNRTYLSIPLFSAAFALASCSGLYLQSGKTAYQEEKYMEAIQLLEKGLSGKEDPAARKMLAEANMILGNYSKAADVYALANTEGAFDDKDRIAYGQSLMTTGNYDLALELFEGILSREPGHPVATSLARACRNIEELMRDSTLYNVSLMAINGLETAFSPAKINDDFIVSGEKTAPGPKDPYTGYSFTDLYLVKSSGMEFENPVEIASLNSSYHEGVVAVTTDGKTIYISRSYFEGNKPSINADNENNIGIWISKQMADGTWNSPALLPQPFNDINYNYLHPALSKDGKTMYFASDIPGGYGGMDLYKSTFESSKWTQPINLGETVNTSGDESFPYLKSADTLYYSSDAHFGLGGKDIMYSVYRNGKWSAPFQLGYPLNTRADDFGVYFDTNGKTGLLSSNRNGKDRIYSFEIVKPVFNINGLVTTKKDTIPLSGAEVAVTNITDRTEEVLQSDGQGEFKYPLLPGKNYRVKVSDDGHFSQTKEISTIGKNTSQDFTMIFDMEALIISEPSAEKQEDESSNQQESNASADAPTNIKSTDNEAVNKSVDQSKKNEPVDQKDITKSADKTKIKQPEDQKDIYKPAVEPIKNEPVGQKGTKEFSGQPEKKEAGTYLVSNIYWDYNKWNIRSDAEPFLDELVKKFKDNPNLKVELQSHCDCHGSDAYNDDLSQKRANALVEYLVAKGVSRSMFISKGFGERKLINECKDGVECTDEQHQQNRRTEFIVLKK